MNLVVEVEVALDITHSTIVSRLGIFDFQNLGSSEATTSSIKVFAISVPVGEKL